MRREDEAYQEAIKDLQKEVKSLREEVSTGKGIVKVLFLGTIANYHRFFYL